MILVPRMAIAGERAYYSTFLKDGKLRTHGCPDYDGAVSVCGLVAKLRAASRTAAPCSDVCSILHFPETIIALGAGRGRLRVSVFPSKSTLVV